MYMRNRKVNMAIRLLFLVVFGILMITGRFQIWLILYIAGVLVSPIFGRIYCGYVCPMNTVMRPIQKFSRKIGLQRMNVPSWLESPKLAYVVLALTLITLFLGKSMFNIQLPILLILFFLSIIVTFFVKSPVWHNGLCPYSILLRLGAKFALYSKQVDQSACVGTRHCMKVCPSGAISVPKESGKAVIDTALCHQCEACSSVCPSTAISYHRHR